MHTTKIRTTIAALATAFTVALVTAPVTPDAHARPDNGGYQNSSEAHRKGCQLIYRQYLDHIANAVQIEGDPDHQNYGDDSAAASDESANERRDAAKQAGCDWAQ